MVLNRGRSLRPRGVWQSLEGLAGGHGSCSISYEARDSPPSQRRIQPQVSVSLWCETRVGSGASLSTGTRVSRSTEGQEMRHRQTWAGVQAVSEVTSYPVGLGFILCESGMPKIIRPPVGFLQGCDKAFVLLSGWHRVSAQDVSPFMPSFPHLGNGTRQPLPWCDSQAFSL